MHIFPFAEIQSATNDFDEQLVLGEGAFGKVYKGLFAEKRVIDGHDEEITTVAIKRLNSISRQGCDEFQTEISMLSKFRHDHIVSLLGYCHHPLPNSNNHEMVLVYEFMPGGTLADRLYKKNGEHGKPPLSWVQRLKICMDTAHGMNYLHTGGSDLVRNKDTADLPKVIHSDMKSSNILLDYSLAAKVSDFGFAKLTHVGKSYYVMNNVKGTLGYMDLAYRLTKRLTRKSDVYSFGVVLLEVLCGRAAVDLQLPQEQHRLTKWAKQFIEAEAEQELYRIVDRSLGNEIQWSSLQVFVKLVNQCLNNDPKKRPSMLEVVARLDHALSLHEKRDMDSFAAGDGGSGIFRGGINSSIIEEEIFRAGGRYNVQVSSSIREEAVIGSFVIEKENFSVRHEGGNYKQETLDSSVVIEEVNFSFGSDYNKGESSDSIVNIGKGGNNQCENIADFITPSSLPLGPQIQRRKNASSGMPLSDHSKRTYLESRKHKKFKYVIYKINKNEEQVVLEKTGGRAKKHDQFVESLPTNDCRFAVYYLDFLHSDNSRKIKTFLIHWCPKESDKHTKSMYASSLQRLKKELDGIDYQIKATTPNDIILSVLMNRC